ncbi:MAG: beta-ketoacyl-[acyl-carrier-protein] synthase family protein [Prevotellaceae bacterium]|jgi:3-oxoacyl-[acyl-carrier-protein] synthase-1|nr:beta-ketoacyl-[acyl-carrier-protein] synthase family protein [Prevotellaceae bacterium]
MENRVVITGMGIYSCIGKNLMEVSESLRHGKSGIILSPERKEYGYRSGLTGYVERPNLKTLLDRRARMMLPEQGEFAYVATAEALKTAALEPDYIAKHETGILYGNDSTIEPVIHSADIVRAKKNTMMVGSGSVFQTMNSTVTMNLASIFKLKGVNFTVGGACASGSHTVGLGYILIKHGYQDCLICGGAQEVNVFSMGSFDALGIFSAKENDPAGACRPFDRGRDGLVPSGGAATVIVESLEHALKRGAPILAEILGYGFSSNGEQISTPTVDGPKRALEMALKDSGLPLSGIDYINAHATSTPAGDSAEAKAIYSIFGKKCPWISSTKSMTGHECWMAGSSELVYSVLMAQNAFIAPNINFKEPDEDSKRLKIAAETVEREIGTFVSNSFGLGGTNSVLVVKKWK